MLIQSDVDYLLQLIKVLQVNRIPFPNHGKYIQIPATDNSKIENFIIDVNRKGTINVNKMTLLTRYKRVFPLLRVDLEGPDHTNPDGELISGPHIHIYREGFGDRYAYPLHEHILTDTFDLVQVLSDFLTYNNIRIHPIIDHQITI